MTPRDILPKGYRLSLAWIGFFTLPPIILGWSFASLVGCEGGSACYVQGVDWAASGDFTTVLPALTTPIGVVVLLAWIATLFIERLLKGKAWGERGSHGFPYRLYLVALLALLAPALLASAVLWLSFGAGMLPRDAASSMGLTFADLATFAVPGMLVWLVAFVIHQAVARRIAKPVQFQEINP